MTTRLSNTAYLTVLDPLPLENIGWTVRVLSERDYATQIALVDRFDGLGFTVAVNDTGGGKVVLDADDSIFSDALPVGETTPIVGQEALWQFFEDGILRAEMLAEDVVEDVVPDDGGLRTTAIMGRGTGLVLEWAKVIPAGMPTPTTMARTFTAHPMTVWHTLFAEAQAAGYLPFVELLFDAAEDSSGRAWGGTQKVEVQAGDSLMDLLTRWCDAGDLTWRMLPGFKLQVLPVSAGRRMESSVVFTLFRGQEKHERMRTRRDLATTVYAQSGDKGIAVSSSSTSQAKWGKRMAWVSAGDASDATGRSAVANATLALVKDEQVSRAIVVPPDEPTRRVFVDYLLTDWITIEVPENDAESGARQVRAITFDVDSSANVGLELTLQSRFQSRQEKLSRKLEALGASAASGGSGGSAIPVAQVISATKVEDLSNVDVAGIVSGNVLQWNGAKWVDGSIGGPQGIDWLTDVDTVAVAPTNGQALVYDAVAGLWKPMTLSSAAAAPAKAIGVYPPASITSALTTGTQPAKGGMFWTMADLTVTSWAQTMTTVAGKTYRLALYEVAANGLSMASGPLYSVDVVSPGSLALQMVETGPVVWELTGGKRYAFMVTVTDASVPQINVGGTLAAGAPGMLLCVPPSVAGHILSVTAVPVNGTVTTGAASIAACRIEAQTRG